MVEGEWWYVKDGDRHGPLTIDDLEKKLLSDEISVNTPVWHAGMTGWTRMAEVDALQDIVKECPPPIDADDEHLYVSLPEHPHQSLVAPAIAAGPWSRFIARQIDILLFSFLASFILELSFPSFNTSPVLKNQLVAGMVYLPLALLTEVLIMGLSGGTPGKWIFGIKVRRLDGARLSLGELAQRNLLLWAHGFGLGIPIVNLFFFVKNYRIASSGQRCQWDKEPMHNVSQKDIGGFRFAFGCATLVCLLLGISFLTTAVEKIEPNKTTVGKIRSASWLNPLSGRRATLYGGWSLEERNGTSGAYLFKNQRSVVGLGRQKMANVDIGRYIGLLQSGNNFGILEGKRAEVDKRGHSYYTLSFRKIVGGSPYRVELKVWQTDPQTFWRSVVIVPEDDDRAKLEARSQAAALEKSTFPP